MNELRSASQCLAAILLGQMIIGPVANFWLLDAAITGPGGFLVNAAPHATGLATAVLLSVLLAVLSAGIAIVLWPALKPHSERMALSLAILAGTGIALSGFENTGLLSMLTLSQSYAAAGAPDGAMYEALREVVRWQRNWAHLLHLLASGGLIFLMYVSLYRFRLAPRWLAGFGVLAAVSQMIAVAKPVYGGWVIFPMLAPLGLAHLLLVGWLLWKPGFRAVARQA